MKEQAEFYRVALISGLVEVSEVIAWCDSVIMAEESPDVAIIEASLFGSQGKYHVAEALSEAAGDCNSQQVRSRIFRLMHDLVVHDRKQALRVAWLLYRMALDNGGPHEENEPEMWHFYDAIDLAAEGIYGDEQKLIDEMLEFLEKHSSPTP